MDRPWSFGFSDRARSEFKTLDRAVQKRIQKKIEMILSPKKNPIEFFKPLTGQLKNLFSLRTGDFRMICHIDGSTCVIIALHVGHRRHVYTL